jgi:hypothetical protein
MTKRDQLILSRDTLVKASQVAAHVVDDAGQSDEMRDAAYFVEFCLSEALLHQSHSADGERSIRLLPIMFGWPNAYSDMVDELLLDLGEDVVAENPARVAIAKHAARLVDDALYSSDFRMDAYDALNEILAGLKAEAEVDEEVVE